jgi:hypothetical protein
MSEQPVVLAVVTCPSKAAAEAAFHAVWGLKHEGELDHVTAAIVEKTPDGRADFASDFEAALTHTAAGG